MNILFFPSNRSRGLRVALGPMGAGLVCLSLLFFVCGIFLAGSRYAENRFVESLYSIRNQTESVWQVESNDHIENLRDLRLKAEKSLDAMAGRLSLLQGHVMRLDALGSRLASMADLQDIEFGVDKPPGMGGPEAASDQASINLPDFLTTLDQLELTLQDRIEKLNVMESLLIDQDLQEQTSPAGRPARGGWLSSLYGYRTDPLSGKREFHQGIDFAGKPATPVTTVAAGIVIWSGPRYGYGNLVEVSHGNGYITRYAHNQKNLVSVGEKVEKADVIALMGNSGRSTGTHVHFEVLKNGRHLDPRQYISLK